MVTQAVDHILIPAGLTTPIAEMCLPLRLVSSFSLKVRHRWTGDCSQHLFIYWRLTFSVHCDPPGTYRNYCYRSS
jgi:hypothetical protein